MISGRTASVATALLAAVLVPGSWAAAPLGEPAVELDEVAVVGKGLRELHHEVIEAENRFYKRFNTLNTRDEFDIHCRNDKATGTLVARRQCRVQFLVEAGSIDGQEFLKGLTLGTSARGVNTPVAALEPQWLLRRGEYFQTVRALMEKDPELMALAVDWGKLREQYERALR